MSSAADLPAGDGSLRQRTGVASQPVLSAEHSASNHPLEKEPPRDDANRDAQQPGEYEKKPNKTYGRTPDGTGMPMLMPSSVVLCTSDDLGLTSLLVYHSLHRPNHPRHGQPAL